MVHLINTFEGLADATDVTTSNSGGGSGDAFTNIIINNGSTPGGGAAIHVLSASAFQGSRGVRYTPNGTSTYLRWNYGVSADRYVGRQMFKFPGNPAATVSLLEIRSTAGGAPVMGQLLCATDGKPYLSGSGISGTAAKPSSALVTGDWYAVELAIKKETGGGGNGVVAYRLLDEDENELHTYAYSAQTTGTTDAQHVRFLNVSTASAWSLIDLDSFQAGDLASGWLGPLEEVLGTPVVTLGATTNPTTVGGDDGSQVVTWDAIDGAASYDALIAAGATPAQEDFTLVEAGVTSPYTFEDLEAGSNSYGIQAKD